MELKQHIASAKNIILIIGCRTIVKEDRNNVDNNLIWLIVVICKTLWPYFIDKILSRSIAISLMYIESSYIKVSICTWSFIFLSLYYNPLFDIRDGHCCWSVNMHVVTCYKRATIFFSLLPYVTFARKNKTGCSCYGCNNYSWF